MLIKAVSENHYGPPQSCAKVNEAQATARITCLSRCAEKAPSVVQCAAYASVALIGGRFVFCRAHADLDEIVG